MNPRPRVLDELGVELMRAAATVLDPDTTTPTLTRSPVARAIIARRLRGISTLAASATVAIAVVAAVVLLIRTHQTAPDGRGANQPQLADRRRRVRNPEPRDDPVRDLRTADLARARRRDESTHAAQSLKPRLSRRL